MQGPTGVGVVTSFVQNGILGNSDLENVYIWSISWNISSIFGVDGRKFGPEWLQIPKRLKWGFSSVQNRLLVNSDHSDPENLWIPPISG